MLHPSNSLSTKIHAFNLLFNLNIHINLLEDALSKNQKKYFLYIIKIIYENIEILIVVFHLK